MFFGLPDLVPSAFFFILFLFLLLALSFRLLFENHLCLHHFSFVYQKVRFFLGKCYSPNNHTVRGLTCTLAEMFFGLPRVIWCWKPNPFHQKILFSFLNLHFDNFLNNTDILSFFAFLVNLIRIQEKCRPFVISSFCVVLILWCRNQWLLKNNGLGIVLKWK